MERRDKIYRTHLLGWGSDRLLVLRALRRSPVVQLRRLESVQRPFFWLFAMCPRRAGATALAQGRRLSIEK